MSWSILDENFCAVVVLNEEFHVEYFNNAFINLTGKGVRQIKKYPTFFELLPELKERLAPLMQNALKQSEIQLGQEMSMATAKGTQSFVVKVVPLKQDEKKHLMLFFNDVTVERTLYEKYRQKLADLKQNHTHIVHADRLRALGELTSTMAHEVNNPLTVAVGNAELVEFSLENTNLEEERDNIKNAQINLSESLTRIDSIIQGMRQFVYKGETNKEYVSLQDVVESSVKFLRTHLENKSIKINIKKPNVPILVLVDKLKIEQVLVNLLTNAKDALEQVVSPEITIEIRQDRNEQYNQILVHDNGQGIPEEFHDTIYQSFFSTKPQGVGTGLGLSIARRLAEAHQGTLTHESKKGSTTFILSLPMIEVSSFAEEAINYQIGHHEDGHRILVIDNEVGVLNLFKNLLTGTSYSVIGSTGVENILSLIGSLSPSIVITDIEMPGLSGRELAKRIRQIEPHVPIVYMSSPEHKNDFIEDKDKYQIYDFLSKPFNRDGIVEMLKRVIKD